MLNRALGHGSPGCWHLLCHCHPAWHRPGSCKCLSVPFWAVSTVQQGSIHQATKNVQQSPAVLSTQDPKAQENLLHTKAASRDRIHPILPTHPPTLQGKSPGASQVKFCSWRIPESVWFNVYLAWNNWVYGVTLDFVGTAGYRLSLDLPNATGSEAEIVLAIQRSNVSWIP